MVSHILADTSRFWELAKNTLPSVSYRQDMIAANDLFSLKKKEIELGATLHTSH